jgi:hypothetical protein
VLVDYDPIRDGETEPGAFALRFGGEEGIEDPGSNGVGDSLSAVGDLYDQAVTALGHRTETFWNPTVLRFYLDGIQFAIGDLKAPD